MNDIITNCIIRVKDKARLARVVQLKKRKNSECPFRVNWNYEGMKYKAVEKTRKRN